jgi:hypothetical protein
MACRRYFVIIRIIYLMVTPSVIDILYYDMSARIVNADYIALNILAEIIVRTIVVETNGSVSVSIVVCYRVCSVGYIYYITRALSCQEAKHGLRFQQ